MLRSAAPEWDKYPKVPEWTPRAKGSGWSMVFMVRNVGLWSWTGPESMRVPRPAPTPGAQAAPDRGGQLVGGGVGPGVHEGGHLDTADFAHLPQGVAEQVDGHEVFRACLGVGAQFTCGAGVGLGVGRVGRGAFDGAGLGDDAVGVHVEDVRPGLSTGVFAGVWGGWGVHRGLFPLV